MTATADIDVLVVGHMTVDIVPCGKMLGGTVSYAAPTYAAFGHRVGVLTSAAYDESLLGHLLHFGKVVSLPARSSLTYENVYSDRGRQQFVRATACDIRFGDLPNAWLNAPYVHLGPLAAELDPLEMARNFPNATVMLTLQGLMRQWGEDGLVRFRPWFDAEALRLIDIVVYSQEDIQQYPQLTEKMRAVCKHLIVTNGRNGGTYYNSGGQMAYASSDVIPQDLTGAGDVFAASLLGLLPFVENDVRKAISIAGRLAAYSVTRSGLDSAPTAEEIADEIAGEVKRVQGG
ncbi:MAG: PfkB family carbohydrate kinase [Chloroflexi bacterium]|nr:PfkB family carbohydrate kinase [Chloroflexota bacterium]